MKVRDQTGCPCWSFGAVAGGLAAAEMGERKGAGQQIVGKVETPREFKLALAES